MVRTKLSLLVTLAICLCVNAKFPDDPKPCKYGDTDCIAKGLEYFLHEKNQGDGSINLIAIDPLVIKEISIKQGAESPVNIDLQFINNKLTGLKNAKVVKVKGFGKDLAGKHEIHLMAPEIELAGNYKVDGRILVLPITGTGTNSIKLINVTLKMQFVGVPMEKDGKTYLKVEKFRMDLDPKGIHFKIDNLFNGDKTLGDNMNLFLNENWEDIYRELRGSITSAFGKVFQTVIGHVFTKYPYDMYLVE
ncbi:protein takeout-like [Musca vetustissima]|uniref:protein takeout-like n=1 Tax=Musca vetustissima TaxID=27455 RepID=UPI002AB63CE0|nr:protein takeout-like [Musca vetustissima]